MKSYMLIFLIAVVLVSTAFADEITARIDQAAAAENTDELKAIMDEESIKESYPEIENYLVGKAKNAVIAGNYGLARKLLDLILLKNLDNIDAQDMYISLEREEREKRLAEEKKQALEEARLAEERRKKEEEKRLLEEQRLKEENEKLKVITQKMEEEKLNPPPPVIVEVPAENPFSFYGELGAADFIMYRSGFFSDVYGKDKTSFRYGISLGGTVLYNKDDFSAGFDLYAESFFLKIAPESASVFSWKAALYASVLSFPLPLYLRLGWTQTSYNYPDDVGEDMYITSLFSPLLGIGLKDLEITEKIDLSALFDFYIISFMTSYFDGAFDTGIGIKYDLPDYKKYDLYLRGNIAGTFVLGDSKMENNLKLQIIAGAGISNE